MKDISLMTKEEFDRYGLNRMKIMLKMKKQSEACLQKRHTPLQDIILQTAENHLWYYTITRCRPAANRARGRHHFLRCLCQC